MLWSVGLKLKAEATETLKKDGDRYQIILTPKRVLVLLTKQPTCFIFQKADGDRWTTATLKISSVAQRDVTSGSTGIQEC